MNKESNYQDVVENFKENKELENILISRSLIELSFLIDDVVLRIDELKLNNLSHVDYELQKSLIKFFYGLMPCVGIDIDEILDVDIVNVDLELEDYILKNSVSARKLYEIIESVLAKKDLEVIETLTSEFKNVPSLEDIGKLKDGFNEVFNGQNSEDLKTIKAILEFNDPNMKRLRDNIFKKNNVVEMKNGINSIPKSSKSKSNKKSKKK